MTPQFPWPEIDTIFLDMDGVLLDRYFDDYFWTEFVPLHWQQKNGGDIEQIRKKLVATYKKVENTLDWYDPDYWSERLQLDIVGLKQRAAGHINLRPHALEFLAAMQEKKKPLYLITNAHPKTIAVKLAKFDLRPWFQQTVSTAEIGYPKEQPQFWKKLQNHLPYAAEHTFFADDTERILLSAKKSGPQHLLHIAKPNSKEKPSYSHSFPSTDYLADITRCAPEIE